MFWGESGKHLSLKRTKVMQNYLNFVVFTWYSTIYSILTKSGAENVTIKYKTIIQLKPLELAFVHISCLVCVVGLWKGWIPFYGGQPAAKTADHWVETQSKASIPTLKECKKDLLLFIYKYLSCLFVCATFKSFCLVVLCLLG